MNPIRAFFWPNSKKKLMLKVLVRVTLSRLGLWFVSFRQLSHWMVGDERLEVSEVTDWKSIREVVSLVKCASRFVPSASCLTQALATQSLLAGMGQTCILRIGVDKDDSQKLIAHAWIEVEGKIIIGKLRDIGRYSILARSEEQPV